MGTYSDKEFKDLYSDAIENIKTLTTKWDPEVSDESDPGIAILKTFVLFMDKLQYRQNYRNAQNSVTDVTSKKEAKKLFFELGYQMVNRSSANGNLSVKYLDSGTDTVILPLFTQFSDTYGNLIYTSVRSIYYFEPGDTKLVNVQEGIPVQYSYEGITEFNKDHITSNLRLKLNGYSDIAINSVVICTVNKDSSGNRVDPVISDWLNIEDNLFSSIETSHIFSVGHDEDGNSYIQFYDESLDGLENGIEIWVLSSAGSAGNCDKNKINKISSELSIDTSLFKISHEAFTNGSDSESIELARNNYYDSFGVNKTIVSERDYKEAIEKEVGTDLVRLVAKALVNGNSGNHNLVEVISKLDNGKDAKLVKLFQNLISVIFVDCLKNSNDYYSSFSRISDISIENQLKKALFKKDIVSNKIELANKSGSSSSLYDRFIYDVSEPVGTIITNNGDTVEETKEKIIGLFKDKFNSKNLTPGEMISEVKLSQVVSDNLTGIVYCSFHYGENGHTLAKSFEFKDVEGEKTLITEGLTDSEKTDIVARTVLNGNLKLFKEGKLSLSPGAKGIPTSVQSEYGTCGYFPSSNYGVSLDVNNKIIGITSELDQTPLKSSTGSNLKYNEFIQFYIKAKLDDVTYGLGIKYRLLVPMKTLSRTTLSNLSESTTLLAESIIVVDSVIHSTNLNETALADYIEKLGNNSYKFKKSYTVQSSISLDGNGSESEYYLEEGSKIYDGSTLNGSIYYNLTLSANEDSDFKKNNSTLVLQTGDSTSDLVYFNSSSATHIIKPSFDIHSTGTPNEGLLPETSLTSSQTITTRVYSETTLSSKYYYGVILNNKDSITLSEDNDFSYLMEEGEMLIYSDSDLIDFVEFGSGTMISSSSKLVLDNVVTLDNFNSNLLPLPGSLTITNTEIFTYSEKERVALFENEGSYTWNKVNGKIIVNTNSGEDDIVYDDRYYYRTGLIIKTGEGSTFRLENGQAITVISNSEDTSKNEWRISPQGTTLYLTFSSPLYINSANSGISEDLNLCLVSYIMGYEKMEGMFTNPLEWYTIDDGFNLKVNILNETSSGEVQFNTNGLNYLIQLEMYFPSNINRGYLQVSGEGGEGVMVLNYNPKLTPSSSVKMSGVGTYNIFSKGCNNITLKFNSSSKTSSENSYFLIRVFKLVSGFSSNLGTSTTGEFTDMAVFNKINELLESNIESGAEVPFDFFYDPESEIKEPISTTQFFETDHIMNKNIIQMIDMDKLEDNLKIVRRDK